MSPGKVLYLSYDGLLEPLGGSQVVPVVLGLAAEGFPMEVLSFEKPRDLADASAVGEMEERLRGADVPWHRMHYHGRPSLPATAFDIWKGEGVVLRLARASQGNLLVHARSYVSGVMGLRGLKWFQPSSGSGAPISRLLFDMRGFWVDERLEAGRWKPESLVVSLARKAERRLLEKADWLVHLTEAGMENAGTLAPGVRLPPGSVIPTCVDLARFRPPEDRAKRRRELGLGDGPVIIHTGTLSGWYLGGETFRLARALTQKAAGEFVVLTREVELARELSRTEGVPARIHTVAHEEVPLWLQAADVGLCLVRPGFAKRASAPTKIGEYLATGLVVVGTRGVGDLEEQFRGSPVGLAVDETQDPAAVADGVLRALDHPGREGEARRLAERYYDLADGIQAYARIYRGLGMTP